MFKNNSKSIFSNSSSFSFQERVVVLIFSSFLLVLLKFALRAPDERWPRSRNKENFKNHQIIIFMSGEIENEGRYHFNEGTTLRMALEVVSLKKDASLKGLDLGQKLKTGQRIKIKKLHKPLVNN